MFGNFFFVFWRSRLNFLNNKRNLSIFPRSVKEIIFGLLPAPKLDLVQNKILLCAKYYIYKCRINKYVLLLNRFEKEINYLYKTERYNAIKKDKLE